MDNNFNINFDESNQLGCVLINPEKDAVAKTDAKIWGYIKFFMPHWRNAAQTWSTKTDSKLAWVGYTVLAVLEACPIVGRIVLRLEEGAKWTIALYKKHFSEEDVSFERIDDVLVNESVSIVEEEALEVPSQKTEDLFVEDVSPSSQLRRVAGAIALGAGTMLAVAATTNSMSTTIMVGGGLVGAEAAFYIIGKDKVDLLDRIVITAGGVLSGIGTCFVTSLVGKVCSLDLTVSSVVTGALMIGVVSAVS